jgi:hypothetical protein
MSTFTYKWDEHQESGIAGWISLNHPNFDPSDHRMMVHDVFEHFPRGHKHHYAVDELLALGARMYLRVESGWWWNQRYFGDPSETWANEINTIARAMYFKLWQIPLTKPVTSEDMEEYGLEESDHTFINALEKAPDILIREAEAEDCIRSYTSVHPELLNMVYWMRRGAIGATKRYKGKNPWDVMYLAEQMEKELERSMPVGNYGDLLHVRLHEKNHDYSYKFVDRYYANYGG